MPEYDALEDLDRAIRNRIAKDEDTSNAAPDERLGAAFSTLKRVTASQGAKIDVAAELTTEIRERRGILITMRRWMPATAAAMVVLVVGQNALWAQEIEVSAPGGAQLWTEQGWESIQGELDVDVPLRLKSEKYPVSISGSEWIGHIDSDSIVGMSDAKSLDLERGQLRINTKDAINLKIGQERATVRGTMHVGLQGEKSMRHQGRWIAAGSGAIAVIAVYSGYAILSDEGKSTRIDAPNGAIVDPSGKVERIQLSDAEGQLEGLPQLPEELRRVVEQTQAAGQSADPKAEATGGFWDEEAKTVRFTLAGEVFDAQTGAPMKDFDLDLAVVSSRSFDAPSDHSIHVADAQNGEFRLTGLGLGKWSLVVRAEGYAPSRQEVSLSTLSSDPYLVVPLSQGGQVTGTVADWRGQELEDVIVTLGECTGGDRPNCPTAKTDARGTFILTGAPQQRPFSIHAHHPRFGFADRLGLRLEQSETQHISLKLSGILKVLGHVYRGEESEPVAGIQVRAKDQRTFTDDDGRYEIFTPLEHTPGAGVQVVLRDTDQTDDLGSYGKDIRWVEAETHVAEMQVDFHLDRKNAVLSGQITMPDGAPAAAVTLRVERQMVMTTEQRGQQALPGPTVTDASGHYRIEGLPARAAYRLRAIADGRDQALGTVTIDEPREIVADFTLGGGTIRGKLVNSESGEPFLLGELCILFGAISQENGAVYRANCLDDGSFELKDMAKGAYRLGYVGPKELPIHPEFEEQVVELNDGIVDGLEIRVEGDSTDTWRARVIDESGRIISQVLVRFESGVNVWQARQIQQSDDGVGKFTVPSRQKQVLFDAPGYTSTAVDLSERDPSSVIELTMKPAAEELQPSSE